VEWLNVDEDRYERLSPGDIMRFKGRENEYLCHACILAKVRDGQRFYIRVVKFRISDPVLDDDRFTEFLNLFKGVKACEKEKIIRYLCSISLSR
jgi:hypothetical protein